MQVQKIAKIMAVYNTIVAGGFGLFLLLLAWVPDLRELVLWESTDAVAVALLFPLFAVLGGYTWVYRGSPAHLKPVFIIQLIYKPGAILLLVLFAVAGEILWFWSIMVSLALVIYIIGHAIALKKIRHAGF